MTSIYLRPHKLRSIRGLACMVFCCVLVALAGGCSKDAAELLAEAKTLRAKGEHNAAVIQLKNALNAAPNNGEARYLLGAEYNEVRDGQNAESQLRRARELGMVEGGKVAVELGRALLLNRKSEALLKEISPTPAFEDTAVASIHVLRGRAHLGLGQIPQAKAEFDQASQLQPDAPDAILGQAVKKLTENDLAGAFGLIDRSLAKNPAYYDALLLKGDLQRAKSQNDAALTTSLAQIALMRAPQSAMPGL